MRVPGFVLAELQTLSDSADDTRRARGRRGLDLLATLRAGDRPVEVFDADYPEIPDVDTKLVQLAKDIGAQVVTVDYNLSQVARVQGVCVLNVNDLAAALRPNHLPGETMRIHVVREGKESDQGVGYLEDGTMVVVQSGRALIGEDVDTVVTSVLQTSGGRMIFARPRVPRVRAAIIVAGGSGERFGRAGGKQLAKVAGRPLLAWSVRAFDLAPEIDAIVVVADPDRLDDYADGGLVVQADRRRGRRRDAAGLGRGGARRRSG